MQDDLRFGMERVAYNTWTKLSGIYLDWKNKYINRCLLPRDPIRSSLSFFPNLI